MPAKQRNLVHKHSADFNKPRTYRDRKAQPSKKEERRDHPLHEPYERDHRNLTRYVMDHYDDEDTQDA